MKYQHSFEPVSDEGSRLCFSCGELRMQLDVLDESLFRVALYREGTPLLPTWSVCPGESVMPREGRDRLDISGFPMYVPSRSGDGGRCTLLLGDTELALSPDGPSLSLSRGGEVLWQDRPYSAYGLEGELGPGVSHFVSCRPGERIFGLGEKSGDVDRFGRSFTLGARDAMGYDASSSDPLYKHLPFYICETGAGCCGIFYDTHAQGRFDFGRELDNYYGRFKSFTCEDDALVYYMFLGTVAEISRRFAWLCGGCAFPPKWSLGYCGSAMAYTEARDADTQLRGFLENCAAHTLECSGFYLSSGYTSREGRRYVFTWNREKIPDPEGLTAAFNRAGVHLLPNLKPAFLTDHPMYEELRQKGWFLHYADGSPAVVPFWDGWGSYLDFTDPGAFDFWTRQVKEQLLDRGIDATWNDNNEYHITDPDILCCGFGRPIPARRICQVFPMLMVMASHRAQMLAQGGEKRPMLSTRSGGAGMGRLAQTWTGDNRTSFRDLRFNHKMLLGMSLSGLYVSAHDIGGFAGEEPDPELFLRWLQYGVLLPRFTIHSWNDSRAATEPWSHPELMDTVRELWALRRRLGPMLYDLLYRAHAEHEPFLAPVFRDHPGYDVESDAFLLGHDVLAGCVFDRGREELRVTLPENDGGWYLAGRHFRPGTYTLPCPVRGLPLLFCRGGSVLAEDVSPYGCGAPPEIVFKVYPVPSGKFTADFFDDDGESFAYRDGACVRLRFEVSCGEETVTVRTVQLGKRRQEPRFQLIDGMGRRLVTAG